MKAEIVRLIKKTRSVCPVCLKQIDAQIVLSGKEYYLRKQCPEHGRFSAVIWRGEVDGQENYFSYKRGSGGGEHCPSACGLCADHLNKTCCALVNITGSCNLRCPVCYADAGSDSTSRCDPYSAAVKHHALTPSVDELRSIFKRLVDQGNTFIQLSGGEPTVRDDLPDIIKTAREAGADTVQINSNGVRLGEEENYAEQLRSAGASFIFMQYDGTTDDIYLKLRGRALADIKHRAIDNCARAHLGVTLVPTIVPGINSGNVGAIIDFAISKSPAVRGVHFQPISYFGRHDISNAPSDEDRITLPEILRAIELQTDGRLKTSYFIPSSCDHPRCGFHGDFVVLPHKRLMKITGQYNPEACCCDSSGDAHLKNRRFVSKRWTRPDNTEDELLEAAEDADFTQLTNFAKRVKSHGFTITAMAFQDAYTLDIERLRRCSLHVAEPDGRIIPFCAKYIMSDIRGF